MIDNLNYHFNVESNRLKVAYPFDYDNLINSISKLEKPAGSDLAAVAAYNNEYLKIYTPNDASSEFHGNLQLGTFEPTKVKPDFEDLTVDYPVLSVPYLDQPGIATKHLAPHQQFWADNGFLVIEGMIDPADCDEYIELRHKLSLGRKSFPHFVPYLQYDVIKRMFCSERLHTLLSDLVGEELGLHFNLTPFVSTERGWHQDEYLNPPDTYGRYAAVWIAVDDVPEDSGPFEFIRGSHKLPTVSKDKVMPYLKPQFQSGDENTQDWSGYSSTFVNPAYFFKFIKDRQPVTKFLGKKGDVLIWHSRLIHRGSPPKNPDAIRPGIIGHYSPIRTARWFGGEIRRNGIGGYFWSFPPFN